MADLSSTRVYGDFSVTGEVNSGGKITAEEFEGIGQNITNISAANISSGTLPTSRLSGTYNININGAATSATTAASAGVATTAGTWTTARNFTIGSTTRSVNGSSAVSWTLADIGAAARTVTLSGGDGITNTIGNLSANRTISVDSTVVRTSGDQSISGNVTLGGIRLATSNNAQFIQAGTSSSDNNAILRITRNSSSNDLALLDIRSNKTLINGLLNVGTGEPTNFTWLPNYVQISSHGGTGASGRSGIVLSGNQTNSNEFLGGLLFRNEQSNSGDEGRVAQISAWTQGSSSSGRIDFTTYNSGTSNLSARIFPDGNVSLYKKVGIGTSSPDTALHISNASYLGQLKIHRAAEGSWAGIAFSNDTKYLGSLNIGNNNEFVFRSDNTTNNRFVVNSFGTVTVGTVPWARLSDVPATLSGTVNTSGNQTISGTKTFDEDIEIRGQVNYNTANGGWARGLTYSTTAGSRLAGFMAFGSVNAVTRLSIAHGSSPWENNNGMHILPTGFIGIRKVNPAQALDVNGNVVWSGTATGNGSGLTHLNASNLASGTVPDARMPSNRTPIRALSLGSSTNLDDITDMNSAGFYHQASNANTTGNNYPANRAGSLLIQRAANTSGVGSTHLYIDYAGNDIWFRGNYGSPGNWRTIYHNQRLPVTGTSWNSGTKTLTIERQFVNNLTQNLNHSHDATDLPNTIVYTVGNQNIGGNKTFTGLTSFNYNGFSSYPRITRTDTLNNVQLGFLGSDGGETVIGRSQGDFRVGQSDVNSNWDMRVTSGGVVHARVAFSGNGSPLTNLNASNISGGTVPNAHLPASATRGELSTANITNTTSSSLGFISGRRMQDALTSSTILVRTTGAQSIGGVKTFTDNMVVNNSQILSTYSSDAATRTAMLVSHRAPTGWAEAEILFRAPTGNALPSMSSRLWAENNPNSTHATRIGLQSAISASAYMHGVLLDGNSQTISFGRNATSDMVLSSAGLNLSQGSYTGNGSGLTNLNGSNISSGTVADARIASTLVRTSRTLNIATGDGLSGGSNQNLGGNRTWNLSVDGTVVRTSGNQSISGVKTFATFGTRSVSNSSYDNLFGTTSSESCFFFHSTGSSPSDSPTGSQSSGIHIGNNWGRAQIVIPNNGGFYYRHGTGSGWNQMVETSGNQNIAGVKTFTGNPVFSGSSYSSSLTVRRTSAGSSNHAVIQFENENGSSVIGRAGFDGSGTFYVRPNNTTNEVFRVVANGTAFASEFELTSDRRLKSNLTRINAGNKLDQISGYTFDKKDAKKRMAGVIAQEIQAVLPEAVTLGEDGYLTVSNAAVTGLLIEALKEERKQRKELQSRMDRLEAKMEALLNG